MEEQDQNRSEQATPYKLSEARKRGQVAKSLEFNTLAMVGGLLATMAIVGQKQWNELCQICQSLLANSADLRFDTKSTPGILTELARLTFDVLSPFLLVGVVVAILANLVQTGPILSGDPLKPKFERLSPAAGFKRVFNKKMMFEGFKSVLKLGFLGAIVYAFFLSLLPSFAVLGQFDSWGAAGWLGSAALSLLFRLGLGLLVVGVIDIAFTRWQFSQQMKMSTREVKEEVKRREGDPQIRAKIRELQRENLKQAKSISKLPDADVLITNPTHFAVALRYNRATMNAPIVLAKGSDNWVREMKRIAHHRSIPILENKKLARLLFKHGTLDQPIPAEAFVDVARVYAELHRQPTSYARYEVVHP